MKKTLKLTFKIHYVGPIYLFDLVGYQLSILSNLAILDFPVSLHEMFNAVVSQNRWNTCFELKVKPRIFNQTSVWNDNVSIQFILIIKWRQFLSTEV